MSSIMQRLPADVSPDYWLSDPLLDNNMLKFLSSIDFLHEDPAEVLRDSEGEVNAISVSGLIALITGIDAPHSDVVETWRLIYRCYMTPCQYALVLRKRFETCPHTDTREIAAVRLRTISVLKWWMTKNPEDFQLEDLAVYVGRWMDDLTNIWGQYKIATAMKSALSRFREYINAADPSPTIVMYRTSPPESILPKSTPFTLLDLHPTEIARQVTLVDMRLASKIVTSELLNAAWTKSTKEKDSPNVLKRIAFAARLSYLVHESIMNAAEGEELRTVTRLWIHVLEQLRLLASHNCLVIVYGGLRTVPQSRIQTILEALPAADKESLSQAENLSNPDKNWKAARTFIRQSNPPCSPAFGMYLTDLLILHESLGNYVEGHLINFRKCRYVAAVLRDFLTYRQAQYNFEPQRSIQLFLLGEEFAQPGPQQPKKNE